MNLENNQRDEQLKAYKLKIDALEATASHSKKRKRLDDAENAMETDELQTTIQEFFRDQF